MPGKVYQRKAFYWEGLDTVFFFVSLCVPWWPKLGGGFRSRFLVDKELHLYHNKCMKKKVYLDTTIPSYLFDNRSKMKFLIGITKKWWQEESSKYQVVVSENTINEINRGNYPNKEKVLNFTLKLYVLPYTKDIIHISKAYVENFLMPDDLEGDAMHLAYASYYKIDFLLTWNCSHLANANKKHHIRFLNTRLGLFIPEIITPMELFEEDKDVYR